MTAYTEKWRISLLDKPGNVMGYDFNWANKGGWGVTNPDYFIKIKTTLGPEFWVEGVKSKMLFNGVSGALPEQPLLIHNASQHFWVKSCENLLYKEPAPSNG
jgi:hypothetical protein